MADATSIQTAGLGLRINAVKLLKDHELCLKWTTHCCLKAGWLRVGAFQHIKRGPTLPHFESSYFKMSYQLLITRELHCHSSLRAQLSRSFLFFAWRMSPRYTPLTLWHSSTAMIQKYIQHYHCKKDHNAKSGRKAAIFASVGTRANHFSSQLR